jgi:hypothetical protein
VSSFFVQSWTISSPLVSFQPVRLRREQSVNSVHAPQVYEVQGQISPAIICPLFEMLPHNSPFEPWETMGRWGETSVQQAL